MKFFYCTVAKLLGNMHHLKSKKPWSNLPYWQMLFRDPKTLVTLLIID